MPCSALPDRLAFARWLVVILLANLVASGWTGSVRGQSPPSVEATERALKRAVAFFRQQVAVEGGYVYHYSLDLRRRWGEGEASPRQIWVQPPGTPTVGLAYLDAYDATSDPFYLEAAVAAARALTYGQLESGGWTNLVDFDPRSSRVGQYRNGKGKGRNYSTLDDGITQEALRFLMHVDQELRFQDKEIHESVRVALDALLAAQFPIGAFPQVWDGPSASQPILSASYPDYEWRTENRLKEYWNLYTLNDDLSGSVSRLLVDAHQIYGDPRCLAALKRLGDFLVLAQLPDPQPAWAQQYDYRMRPVWARKFEPPAVAGRESEDAIETLLTIYVHTADPKYLEPIPRALDYLRSSHLPEGGLARYYELQTNRPLYMTRDYQLTYDDRDVPSHYGWKTGSQVDSLSKRFELLRGGQQLGPRLPSLNQLARRTEAALDSLDEQGRWVSRFDGSRQIGQLKLAPNEEYLASSHFAQQVAVLCDYLRAARAASVK